MDEMGRVPWDRFQTLCGIQYYFDTEFQLLRGHMLYAGTEWALSSINQQGFWEKQPFWTATATSRCSQSTSGISMRPPSHLVDESGRGKAARDCTPDESPRRRRDIVSALTSNDGSLAGESDAVARVVRDRPRPDQGGGTRRGQGRAVGNETPYLGPIIGDWDNRPSSHPGTRREAPGLRTAQDCGVDLELRNVWQARHGGYQVHNNSVVFAGTWNKTFTQMTSMEAACESGRHAVNAILDHYVWVPRVVSIAGTRPPSAGTFLSGSSIKVFRVRFGCQPLPVTTATSSTSKIASPPKPVLCARWTRTTAGDRCHLRGTYRLRIRLASLRPPSRHSPRLEMFTSTPDYSQHMFAYLQAWRQMMEQWAAMTAGFPFPTAPPAWPTVPFMPTGGQLNRRTAPFTPPMPPFAPQTPAASAPPATLGPPAPADYTQQLFNYLQAWRQYLEQMADASVSPPAQQPAAGNRPADDTGGDPTHRAAAAGGHPARVPCAGAKP